MKKDILKKLAQIKKVAEATKMEGKVTLKIEGISLLEWDAIVNSIDEYPRFAHFVDVTPKLNVTLLLG